MDVRNDGRVSVKNLNDSSHATVKAAEDSIAQLLKWGKRALVAFFLLSVCLLIYYQFVGYRSSFHSDAAAKNLLANEILRQGSYFPSDWNYVNGDIWVLFGQTFIVPFLPFAKNGFVLHAISGAISAVLILWSVWLVASMSLRSNWMKFLVLTIFAGGISSVMAENLYGQVSYGNVLFFCCFTLYAAWRWLEADTLRSKLSWAAIFSALSIVTFWGNPQRAAAYDALPLVIAAAAWAYASGPIISWNSASRRFRLSESANSVLLLCLLLAGSAIIGSALHAFSISGLNNTEGAGSARWLDFKGLVANIPNTLQGILGIFGAIPVAGEKVTTPAGAIAAVRLLTITMFLVLIPYLVKRAMCDASRSTVMFATFVAAGLGLFVFLQMTTSTADMTDPVTSGRYMVPFLALAIVLCAYAVEHAPLRKIYVWLSWTVLLVLLASIFSPGHSFYRMLRPHALSVQQQLALDLQKAGLKYGYATFWNAGAVSVLSGGEVRVRQILVRDSSLTPFRHLSSNAWYRPEAWKGETFLALTQEEAAGLDEKRLLEVTGPNTRVLQLGKFKVWVFPTNIAAQLPGWNKRKTSDPDSLLLEMTSSSRHVIGQEIDHGAQKVLVASPGEVGFLHFGPYVDLAAGKYRVTVDVSGEANGESGYVEVVDNLGSKRLAYEAILGGQKTPITFEIESDSVMPQTEFRVFSNGKGAMTLKKIAVVPTN